MVIKYSPEETAFLQQATHIFRAHSQFHVLEDAPDMVPQQNISWDFTQPVPPETMDHLAVVSEKTSDMPWVPHTLVQYTPEDDGQRDPAKPTKKVAVSVKDFSGNELDEGAWLPEDARIVVLLPEFRDPHFQTDFLNTLDEYMSRLGIPHEMDRYHSSLLIPVRGFLKGEVKGDDYPRQGDLRPTTERERQEIRETILMLGDFNHHSTHRDETFLPDDRNSLLAQAYQETCRKHGIGQHQPNGQKHDNNAVSLAESFLDELLNGRG